MSKRYSIAEARASLPTIIDEVEAGAEIELTRRGRSVAVVVSRPRYERLTEDRPRFADAYRAFRDRYDLKEVGLDPGALRDVRDRSVGRNVDL